MMNRLDQVVKLLKEQLREIEQEKRLLEKAEDRVNTALAQFDGATTATKTRTVQGPHRFDSTDMVLGVLSMHVEADQVFTRKQATVWCKQDLTDDPLRVGQIHGAIQKLKSMGFIESAEGRGAYTMGETEEVKEET
jgi:hypothetical protein